MVPTTPQKVPQQESNLHPVIKVEERIAGCSKFKPEIRHRESNPGYPLKMQVPYH